MQKPKILAAELEINSYCNRTCSYCPNSVTSRDETGDMDFPTFKKIISELKVNQFEGRLSFHFYGEPLLSKNLDAYLAHATKELPLAMNVIFTNGSLLTKKRFLELLDSGAGMFIVTKQEQDNELPVDLYFDDLTDSEKKKLLYRDHSKLRLSNRAGSIDVGNKDPLPLTRPCLIPQMSIYFTLSGKVLPCFEDYHQTTIMGDITTESLSTIWNKPDYIRFREDLKKGLRKNHPLCAACDSTQLFIT